MRGLIFNLMNNKNISPLFVSDTTIPSQFPHCMETCSHQMNQSQWNKFNGFLKKFFKDLLVKSLKKLYPSMKPSHLILLPFMVKKTEMLYPRTIVFLWPESESGSEVHLTFIKQLLNIRHYSQQIQQSTQEKRSLLSCSLKYTPK